MHREQAKKLIRDTFESSFDKEKFIKFIINFLNLKQEDIQNTKKGPWQGIYIPEAFRNTITKYERIAKYITGGNRIDVLVVYLKRQSSVEHARTMQRNFVAGYLRGNYGSDALKDAALVAFVSPNKEDWRFSLVKIDYRIEVGKSGRVKIKEEFTPARRWSFLVGKNEKSHTAQSRLMPILEDDKHYPTLAQLEEAFNIEPVTKEFFEKYRNLLIRTVDALDEIVKRDETVRKEFESKNINTINFAKKLLGQIVFLYFLQKKGWFGVGRDAEWGTGPKDFLRRLFNKEYGDYKNFFNEILKPLFYEALARERDDNFYSRFNCKIPFLNGGLFEPIGDYNWVHTDILIPNDLFSNTRKTPEGDTGDGILDVFDRFNFTVKEDEPLEKEVAIDPELLGKLYEKFNAIRPDNFYEYKKTLASGKKQLEKQFNKKFGVYYTPREIVHYMCQQSLIHYLYTSVNQELKKQPAKTPKQTKLIGPEEPEQLMINTQNEIISKEDFEILVKYGEQFTENEQVAQIKKKKIEKGEQKTTDYASLLPESIRRYAKEIDNALKKIKVCDPAVGSGAFLVGMMHEIVKTRSVLTIFINEPERTTYNFKRECIENSLYGVEIDPGACEVAKLRLWLSLIVDEEDMTKIKPLPNLDYKIMQGDSLKSKFLGINFDVEKEKLGIFKEQIDQLVNQFQQKKIEFLNEPDRRKKKELKEEIENLITKIFEEQLKTLKFNFFSRLKSIEEKSAMLPNKEQRDRYIKEEKEKLYKKSGFNLEQVEKQFQEFTSGRKQRPFFPWKLYFAEVFQENGGFDVVIGNPPYVQLQKDGGRLAKLYKDCGYKTFERTGDIYTLFYEKGLNILKNRGHLCFITSNKWMRAGYGKSLRELLSTHNPLLLIDLGPGIFESATVDTNIIIVEKRDNQDELYGITLTHKARDIGLTDFVNKNKIRLPKMGKDTWFIGTLAEMKLKEKIECIGKPLKEWDVSIYRGILTGLNKAFIITTEKRNEILASCKDEDERKRTEAIIKPILRGRDIKRYYYKWAGLWVIVIPAGWTNQHRGSETPENFINKTFPALMQYLEQFEEKAKKRDDKGDYWWELRHCAYYPEFEKEKVVWKALGIEPAFSLIPQGFYNNDKANLLTSDTVPLKFLVGFFNSKLFQWIFKNIGVNMGQGFEYKVQFILRIPLPPITPKIEGIVKQIEALVDKILEAKKQNPQANTSEREREIDKLVYKLYNLTDEEIEIVEGRRQNVS